MKQVLILYYSDIMCVWAHIAQLRVNEVQAVHGNKVRFEPRFCTVFGDTHRKIPANWKDRGGFEGFNAHVRHAAGGFPEVRLHPDLWLSVRPRSSNPAHLMLKAAQLAEAAGSLPTGTADALAIRTRRAFFETARDIASSEVLLALLQEASIDAAAISGHMVDGSAHAALASDYADAEAMRVQGSPTFVLNDGRQKLYGNVGFRIIDANIEELLRDPSPDHASWC